MLGKFISQDLAHYCSTVLRWLLRQSCGRNWFEEFSPRDAGTPITINSLVNGNLYGKMTVSVVVDETTAAV